jgi:hypothetical protein
MVVPSRQLSVTAAVAVALAVGLSSAAAAQNRNQSREERKLQEAQRQQVQSLVRVVDHAMTEQVAEGTALFGVSLDKEGAPVEPQPGQVRVAWHNDVLKASEGKIYVPFVLALESGPLAANAVAMYIRVAQQGTGVAAPEEQQREGRRRGKEKEAERPSPYAFEDIYFTDLKPASAGRPPSVARAFAVSAGTYDVYVAMKPQQPAGEKPGASPAQVVLHKQQLRVPDFWNGELATSSIIVAERVEQLPAPISADEQRERPYVLGQNEIVPVTDLRFAKAEELFVIFQIYNPTYRDKKPDVTVEYEFFHVNGEEKKLFNKMQPQSFNAESLPPNFDPDAGFQLAAGWSVPLTSFPEGDYQLLITVKDNHVDQEITRDLDFTVAGS